jgi:hypothetical protein
MLLSGIVPLASSAQPFFCLSPDFGAGQQARSAFSDREPPATDLCSVPRCLKLTMPVREVQPAFGEEFLNIAS